MTSADRLSLLTRTAFPRLFDVLVRRGYTLVGPTVRDGAIVCDEIEGVADLPEGWTDEQDGGTYRLRRRGDAALFGYVVGPHSFKRFLFPPASRLWTARRSENGFEVQPHEEPHPRYAFLAARACELQALAIQDKVFLGNGAVDETYRSRREQALIIAVNCGQAASTCFCASMNSGPEVTHGFDILLTEVLEPGRHVFVVAAGTDRGREVLDELPLEPAGRTDAEAVRTVVARAEQQMSRRMDPDARALLARSHEHPRWDDVAARCLACANCTMVCPTCFCSTVEDVTDLTGDHAERWRRWDSCFTESFSYVHGGAVRPSVRARYRQWITHKLSTWHEQFDSSGCVGCGRCITWCPVGIDITEEVRAIRQSENDGTRN